jgi:hypothetical protein
MPGIVLQFSQAVDPMTLNQNTIILSKTESTLESIEISNIISSPDNVRFSFSPTTYLEQNTLYYIIVSPNVQSKEGTYLTKPYIFSFTTGQAIIPSVNLINPSNMQTNVSTSPGIVIRFSESVLNVNNNNVELREGSTSGLKITLYTITLGADNTYNITLDQPLKELTRYYLILNNGITNLTGNTIESQEFSFTTGKFSNPNVSIINPSNNATNISTSPVITIQFTESVENVNINNVELHKNSNTGEKINLDEIILGEDNTYNITLSNKLNELTTYYLIVKDRITDSYGNLLHPQQFVFTTGKLSNPNVIMTEPNNNDTNITTRPIIKINFTEPVLNVDNNNIELHESTLNGTIINIESINQGGGNNYTITFNRELAEFTTYYLIIKNGITDMFNNNLIPKQFS